ncbi:MAG: hypothetical protein ACJ76H_11440 [Bacteriovoracaceae bacterium]
MTKKTFEALNWFQKDHQDGGDRLIKKSDSTPCPIKSRFPTFVQHQAKKNFGVEISDRFSPLNCFTPGWKGESLSSRSVLTFERLISDVQSDILSELVKTKDFPRSIKMALYNEFLSYAEGAGLHFNKMDDLTKFWSFIKTDKLEEEPELRDFISTYTGRVATITFLKLRFVSSLLDQCGLELTDKALLYPTGFLTQIFKKGSLTELKSRALESNLYSWYRPSEQMKPRMKELLLVSRELSITEIIKNVSRKTQVSQDQNKVYSHALSHLSFGLFMNSLQINYPYWVEAVEGRTLPTGGLEQEHIISCKYFGDYLESLALSHWLAQENNAHFRWDEMLCPDFKGREFVSGTFTKICNELQFLTFLVNKAHNQGEKPIEYICRIMGNHYRNRKGAQKDNFFFDEQNPFYTSTYDRVVLNLVQFPKNNPQHFLMAKIQEQIEFLKPNGYMFVLSSKKLFVPSLRERLETILKDLKTEAIFDLEGVKGKGELGTYIYVFRKTRDHVGERQICSYFRISADLESMRDLAPLTEHLRSFYLSHLSEVPPMAQLDFPDTFRVEFFQEAVVNGMLIHSTNEDSSQITHPAYFKGLLDNCVPLDTLFDIRVLDVNGNTTRENGLNLGLEKDLSYFLVVDFRRGQVNLELHPMSTLRSIHSEYGQTLCSYFELQPKIPGLNPNILRNYFNTTVGKQVAHLTFSGGHSLVKGSLSKFFVPKFLTQTETLPSHLEAGFAVLDLSEEKLLETTPSQLMHSYKHIDQITRGLFPRYACEILSRLSTFEGRLQKLIWKMDDGRMGPKISWANPVIQAQLLKQPTRPIMPENEDVYIEFVEGTSPNDLHLPLFSSEARTTLDGELKIHYLELISQGRVIVRMHAEEALILFIHYLLSYAKDVPISKLLRAVHVPYAHDLSKIIEDSVSMKSQYEELLYSVQNSIKDAMRLQIVPAR